MKRIFNLLAVVFSLSVGALMFSGCSYDDSLLWTEISGIKSQLADLKNQVSSMNTIVEKLSANKGIVSVDQTANGYDLHFTDESVISIKNGKDGANGTDGSKIGVKEENGVFYWTVDGEFLIANDKKVAVTGNDGKTPVLSINPDGLWCVDGEPIMSNGSTVPAQGDSFFNKVEVKDGKVVFTLADGSAFTVDQSGYAKLRFTKEVFTLNETLTVTYEAEQMSFVALDQVPAGMNAELDEAACKIVLTVSDPAVTSILSRLIIKGADAEGHAMLASTIIRVPNVNKADFLVWNEGWFGHTPASLNACYGGVWDTCVIKAANPAYELGNTGTVAVKNGNRAYFVCKDAPQLTETAARSLEVRSHIDLPKGEQGMNFAVKDKKNGFFGTSKGLYMVGLDPLDFRAKVAEGSIGDMKVVGDDVYFINGGNLYYYNTVRGGAAVKVCAASAGITVTDGFVWTSKEGALVKVSLADYSVTEVPTTFSPSWNQWAFTPGSLAASKDKKFLYYQSDASIIRFDVASSEFTKLITLPEEHAFYGQAFSINPSDGTFYLIHQEGPWDTLSCTIDHYGLNGEKIESFYYTEPKARNHYWFASQIVFW